MPRICIFGASLIALSVGAGSAFAADLSQDNYTPPPDVTYNPAPAFTWTGFYLGGVGGYDWGKADTDNGDFDADGWRGGLFSGYNFQLDNNVVLGVEGDVTYGNADGSGGTPNTSVKNDWDGTLRGRLGYAFGRFMIYGTGGLAVGRVEASEGGVSDDNTAVGWTAGAGVETAFTDNVFGRLEYRYTDLGSDNYSLGTTSPDVNYTSNSVMAGIGVKF